MNENLPRWIWASISKHFNDYKGNYPLLFEGYDHQEYKDSFQLRIDGPHWQELSKGYEQVVVVLNILVKNIKDEADDHKIYRMSGLIAVGFKNEIKVFKYGDDNSLYGCLELDTPVIITNFGLVENTKNVLFSTVEGQYKMTRSI